jgi:hypothetical protein
MDLRALISAEFLRRRKRNPRYSLRAFARDLGTHHSTLARLLQRRRRLTSRTVRSPGARLGLGGADLAHACITEHTDIILDLARRRGFCADSRWIATRSGLPLDEVNVALHQLVHSGRITMSSPSTWIPESLS